MPLKGVRERGMIGGITQNIKANMESHGLLCVFMALYTGLQSVWPNCIEPMVWSDLPQEAEYIQRRVYIL